MNTFKKKINHSVNLSLALAVATVVFSLSILRMLDIYNGVFNLYGIFYVILLILSFIGLILCSVNRMHKIIVYILGLVAISIISTVLSESPYYYGNSLVTILLLSSWAIIFISISYLTRRTGLSHWLWFISQLTYILLTIIFLGNAISIDRTFSASAGASIYYIICLFPLTLTNKSKLWAFINISILLVLTILSLKRTAMLAVIAGLGVIYILLVKNENTKRSYIITISFFVFLFLSVFSYNFILDNYNYDVLARFQNLNSDGGSNRNIIWQMVLSQIKDFSLLELIIGRGYNGVLFSVGQSAHNDFLEVLFDYGIIGFSLYCCIWWKLISYAKKMLRRNKELAAVFASSIVMAFVISSFSHLIIYPTYFMILCLFWATSINEVSLINENSQTRLSKSGVESRIGSI